MEEVDRQTVLGYATKIPWDTHVGVGAGRAGSETVFLDADDVRSIRRFGQESQSALTELVRTDEDAMRYPAALQKVLCNITDVRILRYALTLIEDFLAYDPAGRAKYFARPAGPGSPPAAPGSLRLNVLPFLQLVGTSGSGARISSLDADPYVLERAAVCSAYLLSVDCTDQLSSSSMLAWIMTNVKMFGSAVPKQIKVTEVAVSALIVLLRNEFLRQLFVDERGIEHLVPVLAARNPQLIYEAGFCMWALSLQPVFAERLDSSGAVSAVSRVTRMGMPLKVLRVCVAFLVNVVRQAAVSSDALAEIVETHVPEVVDALLSQEPRISDPEMLDDLTYLREAIRTNRRRLTSLERYAKDLNAKRFEWTAVHTTDFWKDNVRRFEADDFRMVKQLADLLLDPSVDETTLAVALFDLGEFAVQHPQGRQLLGVLGVRPAIMSFLKREEQDDVKSQALLACSKLLTTHWQFVGAAGGAAAPAAAGAGAGAGGK